jgi:hypothetical protein
LLRALLLSAIVVADASAVNIDSGFTGAWYDPAQSEHGLFVEVLNNNRFLAWWFTFNPAGTEQSWFGVGTYRGNTAAVITQVTQTTDGRWIPNFDPSKLVQIPWGTLTFTFTDCNNGRVDFNSAVPGYGAGSMTLARLTLPAGLTCPAAASPAEGLWTGTTSANQTLSAIILDDGTYYALYSQSGSTVDGGVVQGSSSTRNGELTSSDGVDFPIVRAETNLSQTPAAVSGIYVPRSSLQLTVTEGTNSRIFTASYDPGYQQPASLAAIAGPYTGISGHSSGANVATFTVNSNGNLSGSTPFAVSSARSSRTGRSTSSTGRSPNPRDNASFQSHPQRRLVLRRSQPTDPRVCAIWRAQRSMVFDRHKAVMLRSS